MENWLTCHIMSATMIIIAARNFATNKPSVSNYRSPLVMKFFHVSSNKEVPSVSGLVIFQTTMQSHHIQSNNQNNLLRVLVSSKDATNFYPSVMFAGHCHSPIFSGPTTETHLNLECSLLGTSPNILSLKHQPSYHTHPNKTPSTYRNVHSKRTFISPFMLPDYCHIRLHSTHCKLPQHHSSMMWYQYCLIFACSCWTTGTDTV
jgi:hypothetical protein